MRDENLWFSNNIDFLAYDKLPVDIKSVYKIIGIILTVYLETP